MGVGVDVGHKDCDAGAVCDKECGKGFNEGGRYVFDDKGYIGVKVAGAAGCSGEIAECLVRGQFLAAEFDGDGCFCGAVQFAGIELGGAAAETGCGVDDPGVGGACSGGGKFGDVLADGCGIGGPLGLECVALERDEGGDIEMERPGPAEAGPGGRVEVGNACGNAGRRDADGGGVDEGPLGLGEACWGGVYCLALCAEDGGHGKGAVAAFGHADTCELHAMLQHEIPPI